MFRQSGSTSSSGVTQLFDYHGADGGGRTHTASRPPDFESGASANSATSALLQSNNLRHKPKPSLDFATVIATLLPCERQRNLTQSFWLKTKLTSLQIHPRTG